VAADELRGTTPAQHVNLLDQARKKLQACNPSRSRAPFLYLSAVYRNRRSAITDVRDCA